MSTPANTNNTNHESPEPTSTHDEQLKQQGEQIVTPVCYIINSYIYLNNYTT